MAEGQLVHGVERNVVADVSAAVAPLGLKIVGILRVGSKQSLIIHVIDPMAQAVLQVESETFLHAPFNRNLEAVVGIKSRVALQ